MINLHGCLAVFLACGAIAFSKPINSAVVKHNTIHACGVDAHFTPQNLAANAISEANQYIMSDVTRITSSKVGLDSVGSSYYDAILELNGIRRNLTEVNQQGASAKTYRVEDGGWPDPNTGRNVLAYAKSSNRGFADEIRWLRRINEWLADGRYNGLNWVVFRGVDKVHLETTRWYTNNLLPFLQRRDIPGCERTLRLKLPLVVASVQHYVVTFGVYHLDIQPDNVLWNQDATEANLIDWGLAREATWSDALRREVEGKVEKSFMQDTTRVCQLF